MNLEQIINDNEHFCLFSLPGSKEVKVFYGVNNDSDQGFLFAPFDKSRREKIDYRPKHIESFTRPQINVLEVQIELDRKGDLNYLAKLDNLISRLISKEAKKVVLSRKEPQEFKDSYLDVYFKLLSAYPNAMVYWFNNPGTGHWMGASPEILLEYSAGNFSTMALAGTQIDQGQREVNWGDKEIQEQAYVQDFILDRIGNISENIDTYGPFTSKAGRLLHLKTEIRAKTQENIDLKTLIERLHPTPAVCGIPQKEAMQLISQLEGYDREFYTGYFGPFNKDKASLFVNLRCMKLKGTRADLFVGGGVTEDSEAILELEETQAKTSTMKRVLL